MSTRTSGMFSKSTENSTTTRRHKAAVACIACKVRKIRCSGSAPCHTCVSLDTKCIIDETLDGRRKVAITRRLEELYHHKWILESLLICLQSTRGCSMVAVLETVLADPPLPVLAASLFAALSKCPIPIGQEDKYAKLQRNLGSYVQENESAVTRSPNDFSNTRKLNGYNERFSNDIIPLLRLSKSTRTLEQYLNGQTHYQATARSQSFHFEYNRQPCYFEEPGAARETLGAEIASVAQEIGLDVVVDSLKSSSMYLYREDVSKLSSGYGIKSEDNATNIRPATFPSHGDRKRSSPDYSYNGSCETNTAASKKRPLSTVTIPPAHMPFIAPSTTAIVPSSATSSRRPSVTSSPVYSSFTEHSPLPEHNLYQGNEPAWTGRSIGHYLALPQIELSDQPMACAIASFMDLARTLISQGTPIQDVFGPERAIVDLLFRRRRSSDPHSVCHFAAELCAGVKGMDMPVKLGITFMYIYLMRWMILSSSESYNKIPEMYRPTLTQINISHCAAIELCPLPRLRDALCHRYRDFLPALGSNISCNWPHDTETCIERDLKTGHIMLTDDFARHCLVPRNWTVRATIFDTFPECRGFIKTSM